MPSYVVVMMGKYWLMPRLWRIVWMALLALAVASAWSTGSMAGSAPVHAHANADIQASHAHLPAMTAQIDRSSDQAGVACCVMTICHPALPVPIIQIAHVVPSELPVPIRFLPSEGNEPSPALPPPRNFQVWNP